MRPICLIVGKSGTGKTTLAEELEAQLGLKAIPSYTTRPKRSENEKGHTFITDEEFNRLEDILAYAETGSARYAVTKEMFEDEQYSVYVIDNSGIKYLKECYKGDRPWFVVYITTPLMQRFNRMMSRQNDIEFAIGRIEHDAVEFKDVDCDITIENADGYYSEAFACLSMFCHNKGITHEKFWRV